MARLNRKKTIGLLLCLGAVAVVVAGWARARSIEETRPGTLQGRPRPRG